MTESQSFLPAEGDGGSVRRIHTKQQRIQLRIVAPHDIKTTLI